MPTLGESGSEVSHFISETRNFAEVSRIPADFKHAWLKTILKEIKKLINNQKFLMNNPKKGYPMTPCMDVYKAGIKSDGSLYHLKLRFVVRGELNNREIIGETCPRIA